MTLSLFDLRGRRIAILVNREMAPGRYEAVFDGTGLASGPYFYQLQAGPSTKTKMMLMVR